MRIKLLGIVLLAAAPVFPSSLTVPDSNQGFVTSDGSETTSGSGASFFNGFLFGSEYGNFFEFALPSFTGAVQSATLTLPEPVGGFFTDSSAPAGTFTTITYNVYALPSSFSPPSSVDSTAITNAFNSIGGTVIGSVVLSSADDGTSVAIQLIDSTFLSGLTTGQTIWLGGIVFDDPNYSGYNYGVFNKSQNAGTPQFSLTTGTAASTPEPGSLLLGGTGLLALALLHRRR